MAPAIKPPATMVVAAPSESAGPGAGVLNSEDSGLDWNITKDAYSTTTMNSGTNTVAKLAMALTPKTTNTVMAMPVTMDHAGVSNLPRKSVNERMFAFAEHRVLHAEPSNHGNGHHAAEDGGTHFTESGPTGQQTGGQAFTRRRSTQRPANHLQ